MKKQLSKCFLILLLNSCMQFSSGINGTEIVEYNDSVSRGMEFLENYDSGDMSSLQRARINFEIALKINPKSRLANDGLACVLIREGRFDEASYILHQIIENEPDYSKAYANLAYIELRNGNEASAEALLRKSLDLNHLDPKTLNNLASLLYNKKDGTKIEKIEAKGLFYKARELYRGTSDIIKKNVEAVEKNL